GDRLDGPPELSIAGEGTGNGTGNGSGTGNENGAVTELVEAAIDAEVSMLDRRDDVLEAIERQTTRRLKRVLSDQENALLDRLQRSRKAKLKLDVLEDDAAARDSLWNAVSESL